MAAPITISLQDLNAIKRVAAAPGTSDGGSRGDFAEAALKQSRSAASAARAAQWNNTLAGLRRRKDAARAAAVEAAEKEAQELDAVMAEDRLAERLTILKAANAYFAGQSDKVKALRSYQQRVMDVETNKANAALVHRRKAAYAEETAAYHDFMMAQVAEGDAKDAGGRDALRAKAKVVAADLTRQVREVLVVRQERRKEEWERGQEIIRDTLRMEEEAAAALVGKARAAAAATKAFAADNIRLAASRADAGKVEADLDARVLGEVERHEAKVAKIQGILAAQQAEANRKAKVISDLVR